MGLYQYAFALDSFNHVPQNKPFRHCLPNDPSSSFLVPKQVNNKYATLDTTRGAVWRSLRKSMSPTFTTGKLRGMLEPMTGVVGRFLQHLEELECAREESVEVKALFQGFSLDVIAKCAFGIDTDAIQGEGGELLKYGREVFATVKVNNWFESALFSLFISYIPWAVSWFPIFFPPAMDKLRNITRDIMAKREREGVVGSDFVGRLIELKVRL